MPTCVVFDLDDTLYLERQYVQSGLRAAGEWIKSHLGQPGFADLAWGLFLGGQRQGVIQQALAMLGQVAEPAHVDGALEAYRNHTPQISLLPDALMCLKRLHQKNKLALITDGQHLRQKRKCEQLNVGSWIEHIVFTGIWDAQFAKPHARAFQAVEQLLAGSADSFVYVADNPVKDFQAPRALGWRTIRVRRPEGIYYFEEAATEHKPDLELTGLWQLPEVIWYLDQK